MKTTEKQSTAPPFTALETQCLLPEYMERLCGYARRFGAGSIIAMTGEWNEQTLFDYREWDFPRQAWEYDFARRKREAVAGACRIAKDHGLQFFVWRHELSMHPEHIRRLNPAILDYTYGGGARAGAWGEGDIRDVELGFFDPRRDDLWNYVRWRFEHLFELFPDIDGLVLTCLTETKLPLWNLCKTMSRVDIMARLLNTGIGVCRRLGKRLIVRNWGAYRDPQNPRGHVLPDALDAAGAPDDVFIMEKSIEPDYPLGYPPNRWIPAVAARRPTLVEIELAGEQAGMAAMPVCRPHEVQTAVLYSQKAGCAGFVVRVDSWADTIQWERTATTMNNQNEINLYAALRFIREPERSMAEVWNDWANERFGEAIAPSIIDLLRPTFDAALGLYACRGNHFGSIGGNAGLVLKHLTDYNRWHYTGLPLDKRWFDAFQAPDEDDIRLLVREKREAAAIYRSGLKRLPSLEGRIPKRWYDTFRNAFVHAADVAALGIPYTEALLRAVRFRNTADATQKTRARALIRLARGVLDAAEFPNSGLLLNPDRQTGVVSRWEQGLSSIERILDGSPAK